jgi:hypothetical protein
MLDDDDILTRGTPGDDSAALQLREAYIADSGGVGSIPAAWYGRVRAWCRVLQAAGRISVPAPCALPMTAVPAAPRVAARRENIPASRSLSKPAMSAQAAHFWRTWPTI